MKIATILGARPQFIKAAAVSSVLRQSHQEILIHTGQHYDSNMSDVFFEELGIPKPDYNLGIGGGNGAGQIGRMLIALEELLEELKPDAVMVYGDTNSTLAGALAAKKRLAPLAHVEAGLRSFNPIMPEEANRVLTDHVSTWLFTPTEDADRQLAREGIEQGVYRVGDVMYDAVLHFGPRADASVLQRLGVAGDYLLCTLHRAENTDYPARLSSIVQALNECGQRVVLPLHPRTKKYMAEYGLAWGSNVQIIEPVGYLEMLSLEKHAKKIVTDSGGVQKEAYFLAKPCVNLRDETEWVETVANGWNLVVGADKARILNAIRTFQPTGTPPPIFGDGHAAEKITEVFNRGL